MGNKTPLYDSHVTAGAKMVDFGGWDMPLHYGSQVEEHHQVRSDAGLFDVSHMTVVDITGSQATDYLQNLLANDVAKLKNSGKALYSCMLNPEGGVVDDLIVYFMNDQWFRLVVNAATRDKDWQWLNDHTEGFDVALNERDDLAMMAIQGPNARAKAQQAAAGRLDDAMDLKPFFACESHDAEKGDWFIGRTGYTGEDGFEVMLPADQAADFFTALLAADVKPIGLGARDTLRLEAGMNLYGSDMSDSVGPLQSGLGWTIAWEPQSRDFIGRAALEAQKQAGVSDKLVGLVLEGRGVLRDHQRVFTDAGEGEITSGTFSPTLGKAIALARIPKAASGSCEVEMRGRRLAAKIVKTSFVRNGQSLLD